MLPDNVYSTGLPEVDGLLKGLLPGDNVVWNVDTVDAYRAFVAPFCEHALARGQAVVYFRFASHPRLVDLPGVNVHELRPEAGFELFINGIHGVIESRGVGGCYVFDCLSDLVSAWYSDEMLATFFQLTCPYLLDVEALAYFALLKQRHSLNALQPILQTTQLFLDVFRRDGEFFLHPIKVQQRYSTTMHMLHHWREGKVVPVAQSGITAEIYQALPWVGESSASRVFDLWNQTFIEAEYLLNDPRGVDESRAAQLCGDLMRMVIARDERLLALARRYLTLRDLVGVSQRMIGTGLIGGKSVGMLLAQAILRRLPGWDRLLERHDSFFIGSDVFYSYLVRNGCWWARQQKDVEHALYNARHARRLILTGRFPDSMIAKFTEMLDYFGQAPIIVRSSSLLEDNYGNAFSGKYASVFCPNQGPRRQCLEDLLSAIRTVYASALSEKAIRYRIQCGMLDRDEQMALLVQRVSGGLSGSYFMPLLSGVGYSFNPYVWHESIDPRAGVLRLVLGLGTRAVDRADDDYTRLVALNDPLRRPDHGDEEAARYFQRCADAIDLEANRVVTLPCEKVLHRAEIWQQAIVSSAPEPDETGSRLADRRLDFERLLRETVFVARMRQALEALQAAYGCPVDVEFTANFLAPDDLRINVVQCRPFQVTGGGNVEAPDLTGARIIMRADGPVIGHGRNVPIDLIVYVEPEIYGGLAMGERHAVARLIGRVLNVPAAAGRSIMLIGPGRWGTMTPALGIPVNFAEISRAGVLCELVMMRAGLVPDVSLGTHFFNDLVERDMLYLAVRPERTGVALDWEFLRQAPALDLSGHGFAAVRGGNVLRVIDAARACCGSTLRLHASNVRQQATCYIA